MNGAALAIGSMGALALASMVAGSSGSSNAGRRAKRHEHATTSGTYLSPGALVYLQDHGGGRIMDYLDAGRVRVLADPSRPRVVIVHRNAMWAPERSHVARMRQIMLRLSAILAFARAYEHNGDGRLEDGVEEGIRRISKNKRPILDYDTGIESMLLSHMNESMREMGYKGYFDDAGGAAFWTPE